MIRATSFLRAGERTGVPFDHVVLAHDERHLRRKLLTLNGGEEIMVDLAEPVALGEGDQLVLEDGRLAGVRAADEALYDIRGRDELHLMELCWHLGNRHLPCQIDVPADGPKRLLIGRDHVIKAMLEGLGAKVSEITGPFVPVRGAYHAHGHSDEDPHSHSHSHGEGHAHSHDHDGHHHHHD